MFGAQGEGHLRFGYAITIPEIEACIDALRKFRLDIFTAGLASPIARLVSTRAARSSRAICFRVQQHCVRTQNLRLREFRPC